MTKNFLKRPAAADSVSSKRGDKKQLEKVLRAPLHSEGKAQSSVASNVGQPARVWEIAQMPEGKGLEGHNGNPTLVGKRAPKTEWTCCLCGLVLKAETGKSPLWQRRYDHVKRRHPLEKLKVNPLREYVQPVEASEMIPENQRNWVCPWCPKALPFLDKCTHDASVKMHYKKWHPRRKVTAARMNSIRWKIGKTDPSKVVNYVRAKKTLGDKLRQRAADRRQASVNGHNLVQVHVDWATWERSPRYKYRTGDVIMGCTNCRSTCHGDYRFKQRKCVGVRTHAVHAQQLSWARMSNENKKAYAEAWNISVKEAEQWYRVTTKGKQSKLAKGWVRDLTEEGVEPNPGPTPPQKLEIFSLNTQGANGCWNLLSEMRKPKQPRVVCCQETRMRPHEIAAFKRAAFRAGFHLFQVAGRSEGGVPRGGVMILVDKRLVCQLVFAETSENSQLIGVWVEHVLLWAFYSPPPARHVGADPQYEICDLFIQGFHAASPGRQTAWVAVGDANEVPGDSLLADCLQSYGGDLLAQGTNTRWNSTREVDWFVSNKPMLLDQPTCSDLFLSDHKLIATVMNVPLRELTVGRLQKRPDWGKPKAVPTEDWRLLLENSWDVVAVDLPPDILSLPVQEAWDAFNVALNNMFRVAFQQLAATASDVSLRELAQRAASNKAVMGTVGKWTCHSLIQKGPPENPGFFKLRKQRRRLGRLHELRRLSLLQIREPALDRLQVISANSLIRSIVVLILILSPRMTWVDSWRVVLHSSTLRRVA